MKLILNKEIKSSSKYCKYYYREEGKTPTSCHDYTDD